MEIFLNMLETFGVPVTLVFFLLWYVQRLINVMIKTMQMEARENAERIEKIIINLITNSKNNEKSLAMLTGNIDGLITSIKNVILIIKDKK